jgi:hypothetical protein
LRDWSLFSGEHRRQHLTPHFSFDLNVVVLHLLLLLLLLLLLHLLLFLLCRC